MKKRNGKPSNIVYQATVVVAVFTSFGLGYLAKESSEEPPPPIPHSAANFAVCFTPNAACKLDILKQIDKAQISIRVQAYSFTDADIAEHLIEAKNRGVDVKVILDKSNIRDTHSQKDALLNAQVPVKFDFPPGIAHNKIILIDKSTVITGSYNFSAAAYKRNTENLLIIESAPLHQDYTKNWLKRWEVSRT